MRTTRGTAWAMVAAAGLLAAPAASAQDPGAEEEVDPVKELTEAARKMRQAEELLAQASRDRAATAQAEVDKMLRDLLDQAELDAQKTATGRMLRAAEKAAIDISQRIQKIIDSVQFQQGQGSGANQQMDVKDKPQQGQDRKEQEKARQMDRQQGEKPGGKEQGQPENAQSGQEGKDPADRMYRAQGKDGRPDAPEADPNSWAVNLPPKLQEDALRDAPSVWPGRYEDLIKRWQKTLGRLTR